MKFLLCLIALMTFSLSAQTPLLKEMDQDRSQRDTSIHWPKDFDPAVAPVFSHNEILIDTNCHRAFTQLADATDWPNWFLLTKDVSQDAPGPIQKGTLLHLKIFNSAIQSRVVEFVPDQRISWIPFGSDETETRHGHFHAWRFMPQGEGCRVVTEETGIGPGDVKDPTGGSNLMHRAHEFWLASLKWTSEQQ